MIVSFRNKATSGIWSGRQSRHLPIDVQQRAVSKLALIDAAETIEDLRHPPGNRLHALTGDREGQHTISINMKWRICFVWKDGHAHDVEIVDYH